MTSYNIRLLTIDDAPQAAKLWALVFGDEEPLVLEFFRLFGHREGFGACAELDGQIVAAAYAPEGTDYLRADGSLSKGVYLYAVATHPDHRKHGLARKICSLLKETAWNGEMEYLFTRPSEESLYSWYEDKIGAVPLLGCEVPEFKRQDCRPLPCRKLSAEAYETLRNHLLAGLPHIRQSLSWLHWESLLHTAYGGGFYEVGNAIADVYFDGGAIHVNELLPHPSLEQAEQVCLSLMADLGAETCSCLIHGNAHYVSVAAKRLPLPEDNPWFGSCYG